jgi:NAD(P)-dependent dehydrogenase (short-subunit alcohol dehydrogenase family)
MSHRVVVVTGASAGVGRATAHAFGRLGCKVALMARNAERLEDAAGEVRDAGGVALPLPLDVSDAAAVDAAAERVERTLGPIDVWVNAAMATVFAPFHLMTAAEFHRATEVTYLGFVYGTMAALKRMRARDRGTIVQVGSALAYRSVPLQSAYCGAKAAIRGFTDSIRSELIHDGSGVHITMVHMPALNTPQFDWARNKTGWRAQPIPPIFQPEVAARAIVFAAAARRREIYVGGPTLKAIFANMLAPGLLDRILAKKGYRGQLTDEREAPDRPDNLFEPGRDIHGTHGRFDARATDRSLALWLTERRQGIVIAAAMLTIAALLCRASTGPALHSPGRRNLVGA